MQIHSIEVCNINSLKGTFRVDFKQQPLQECGLFAITGPTGAGKTTLLDALTLALYGQVAREAHADEVMSYGTGECWAEVVFQTGHGTFKAKWARQRARKTSDGNLQPIRREIAEWPSVEGGLLLTKIGEVDQKVQEVLGLTRDQFLKSVLLAQGDFTAFLKANDKARAELLEKMTSTDRYRLLSEQAFRKSKKEAEEEALLQAEAQGIQILNTEERHEKEAEVVRLDQEVNSIRQQHDAKSNALTWVRELERLNSKLGTAETTYATARLQRSNAQPVFDRWNEHKQVESLEPAFLNWERLTKNSARLRSEVESLGEAVNSLRASEQKASENAEHAASSHAEACNTLNGLRPALDQAIAEQLVLETLRGQLQREETRLTTNKGEQERLQNSISRSSEEVTRNEVAQREKNAWLNERRNDADLDGTIESCRTHIQHLTAVRLSHALLASQVEEHQKELAAAQSAISENETARDNATHTLEGLAETKIDLQRRMLGLQRSAALRSVELADEQRRIAARLRETDADVAAKKIFLEHHNNLVAGEPCPLCGSSEHPNLEQDRDTGALEAELQKLQETQKAFLGAQQKNIEDQKRNDAIAHRLASLDLGAEADVKSGALSLQDAYTVLPDLSKEYDDLPAKLAVGAEQMAAANRVIAAQQERVSNRESAINTVSSELQQAEDSVKEHTAALSVIAAQYSIPIPQGQEQSVMDGLQSRHRVYIQTQQALEKLEGELPLLTRQVDSDKAALERSRKDASELTENIKAAKTDITAKSTTIAASHPVEYTSPKAFLDFLMQQESSAAKKAQTIAAALTEAQQQLKSKEELYATRQTDLATVHNDLNATRASLTEALTHQALPDDIATAAARLIPQAARHGVERQVFELNQAVHDAQKLIETATQDLTAHKQQVGSEEAQETLVAKIEELAKALEDILQQRGGIMDHLERDAQNQQTQAALIAQIAEKHQTVLRWKDLADLLGSGNASKFARFAQSVSLDRLLHLANAHLTTLTDRYQLTRHLLDGKELDLRVVDNYHAGHQRDTATLSGGESFLISLGLALGLADMASQNTRIDSLFIDEGFGTLDEMALDSAISTLENLQARGKTIGVISHVEQLKERIQTQVVVRKSSTGFSSMEIMPILQAT